MLNVTLLFKELISYYGVLDGVLKLKTSLYTKLSQGLSHRFHSPIHNRMTKVPKLCRRLLSVCMVWGDIFGSVAGPPSPLSPRPSYRAPRGPAALMVTSYHQRHLCSGVHNDIGWTSGGQRADRAPPIQNG